MVRKILLSLIAVLGLCVYGFAQNRQVSGKVADAEGKPVAGATVMVDGTSTGTTTGTDGKFTIAAPADATLAVSFIGYETRKVAVAGKTHVEVVMHEDAQAIENVVVTAFGTTTKKDLTGSIATIRGEELAKRQVSTVSKMLEGAVPGVQLTTATNQPGTDAAIYVRGVGSLNAGTGALIVLERGSNLSEIIRTGTAINADVNPEILGTIFYEGTPLHDGAVVVRDGTLKAAGCVLPLSDNLEIGKDMGTRHRAALGMSENSDAVVVVVSEETGIISLAKNGVLIRRLDRQNLFNLLEGDMVPPAVEEKKRPFWRRKHEKQHE